MGSLNSVYPTETASLLVSTDRNVVETRLFLAFTGITKKELARKAGRRR